MYKELTDFHAKYYAHELTRRCPSDDVGKLAPALANAQVDMNPHQIDAALFAFHSPLSKGAILADEVGLGKTIEAGILLSQKWAELQRWLLVIVPANLRKQWSQELAEKFFLPTVIMESRTFKEEIKKGASNPFAQPAIVICSYQFARTKASDIRRVQWNLVVIDEAHRLRNVYRPSNKIARSIKNAVSHAPKVLLTATPLQNSLLELYGLVSIIDEYTFGDLCSYRAQFSRFTDRQFEALKERLRTVCHRTLRRQVLEYVKYTNRIPMTQEFYPTDDEQRLYDLVSDYLQRPTLYALPKGRRKLMTLILRKLLGSSTYAISGTLQGLADRLENAANNAEPVNNLPSAIGFDFEALDEIEDEWLIEDENSETANDDAALEHQYIGEQVAEMKEEVEILRKFSRLAKSIVKNSKGEVLLVALKRGFEEARRRGSAERAIVFTESRRTQEYLREILEASEFAGKVVLFNGTNNDESSKHIYQSWLERHEGSDRISGSPTADMRAALVDYFRDEAVIMVATEAASEGINLQFCSLLVNYDLPWNPQRIEQRIGRCHRYGQKCDVVVVNFINRKNAADRRVYQLLDEKMRLFSGVFGTSDEVLGTIDSGAHFEQRIVDIYQKCRTTEQIDFEFDALQKEMEAEIDARMRQTRQNLLEHFDSEVQEKLRIRRKESSDYLSKYEEWLWLLTRHYLEGHARFEATGYAFVLENNPFPEEAIHLGPYRAHETNVDNANVYRVGHPLAQKIIAHCRDKPLKTRSLAFRYVEDEKKITVLEELVSKAGWLRCELFTASAFETEDHIVFSGTTDEGKVMTADQCRRLFTLAAEEEATQPELPRELHEIINTSSELEHQAISAHANMRSQVFFQAELDKLDRWSEDRRGTLQGTLRKVESDIKVIKRESRMADSLQSKLKLERERRNLESKREDAWKEYELAAREIEKSKDRLIDEVEKQLTQRLERKELFTIRWRIV